MDFGVVIENIPLYVEGCGSPFSSWYWRCYSALVLAVPLRSATSRRRTVGFGPRAYIYFFRGTPLLVQMFMIYHGAGQFDLLKESVLWVVFKEAYWCADRVLVEHGGLHGRDAPRCHRADILRRGRGSQSVWDVHSDPVSARHPAQCL